LYWVLSIRFFWKNQAALSLIRWDLLLTMLWSKGCRLITPFCVPYTFVLRKQVLRPWNFSRSSGVWRTTPCCSGSRSISGNIAVDRPLLHWKTINRRRLAYHYGRRQFIPGHCNIVRHYYNYLITVRIGDKADGGVRWSKVLRARQQLMASDSRR